ncbi:hypothetical protein SGLAD_v1c07000 [Spiroplasma gladiatoris]|uniref:Uncharacterized protein n=1 Tax=Spiroplasma gladiatoris TaxID=2143 RepID=A0A4V1AQB3_9MOLU|nr:hypothetical protein [Spiroplasma gladiatoris]QBQ07899.1 hypothetical protein SGLAD_v1c07000 [Spiroplasma gladiatoris]
MWFSEKTIITDILSAIGMILIVITPLYFSTVHRRVLNIRLHTKVDGEKLFEKLKYDLKVPRITGIDKVRLYRDVHYAKTIFKGAMEYNSRDLVWYFNELHAKKFIKSIIFKKATIHFFIMIITLLIIGGGSYLDIFHWLFEQKTMEKDSGITSIWVLLIFAFMLCGLNKFLEFIKIKRVVNDEIRQINLAKKQKVWKDYKIVFFGSFGPGVVGFLFIMINLAF